MAIEGDAGLVYLACMEAVWPPELVLRQLLSYVHYKSVLFAYLRTLFQRSVGGHLRDLPVQLLEIFASQHIVLDSMVPSFGFTRLLCFVSGRSLKTSIAQARIAVANLSEALALMFPSRLFELL